MDPRVYKGKNVKNKEQGKNSSSSNASKTGIVWCYMTSRKELKWITAAVLYGLFVALYLNLGIIQSKSKWTEFVRIYGTRTNVTIGEDVPMQLITKLIQLNETDAMEFTSRITENTRHGKETNNDLDEEISTLQSSEKSNNKSTTAKAWTTNFQRNAIALSKPLEKTTFTNSTVQNTEPHIIKNDRMTRPKSFTGRAKSIDRMTTAQLSYKHEFNNTSVDDMATFMDAVTENPLSNRTTLVVIPELKQSSINPFCPGLITQLSMPEFCQMDADGHKHCLMSVEPSGRLGNVMGQYATLYALAKWNKRPAFMLSEMAKILKSYFEVSIPPLDKKQETCVKQHWKKFQLNDWMEPSYRSLNIDPQQPIMLTGYPCSWTFYHHIRDEILQEFTLLAPIKERAQTKLQMLKEQRSRATFIGVHARRSDYVSLMATTFRGVVADAYFFAQAMAHFRHKYNDVIFVVASDDMEWCRENMNNSLGDVYFIGKGNITDPIEDFALLSQCNHSIITIGTYGYWTAYLAGGDTVYLSNYTLPDSKFLDFFHYETAYLPSWIPIAANLSVLKA